MPQTVPVASIICAVITMLISVGLPVVLTVIVCRRHGKGTFRAILMGAFCFIVGAMVLEQLFHVAVFAVFPYMQDHLIVYGLYGGLAAGLFEETARLLGLKYLCGMRKNGKRDTAPEIGFAYGVGHGGIEAILLIGITMINNIVIMITINAGNADSLLNKIPDSAARATMADTLTQFTTLSPTYFLAGGIERLVAITLHLSLSMLVYMVVVKRIGMWGYPLAIALHAFVDFFVVLYQGGIVTSIWAVEGLMVVLVVAVAALVAWIWRKFPAKAEPTADLAAETAPVSATIDNAEEKLSEQE